MIKQSDLALAAWQSTERLLDAVVTINKIDYKTTDLTSIDYDSGGFTGDTFSIGSNYENSVSIKFSHLVEGLQAGMTLIPKVGVKTANGYEYSSLGVFVISDEIQMDRNNDETTIKAYDQMCLLEGTYTSKLSYPAKVVDVVAEIANMAGVSLNTSDISRLPVLANLPSAIKGQTYRNAIGMLAQFYVGFATFDRDGKLTIRVITEPDYVLDPSQYEQGGLTKNEVPYKIGGIQCDVTTSTSDSSGGISETTTTLQVGTTSGSQVKLANSLMTMDRLQDIWTQIKDVTFYPFSLKWFGNPAIEAGDWLALQDTKGNKFNVPNNGYTMTFDGSLSAVSKADQMATASSSYVWRGPLSQQVADLGGRIGASGNYIYGAETTDPPLNAKFNDLWYKQNGNKTEMWTYERQSDGTGEWVLTVSDLTGSDVKAQIDEVGKDATTAVTNAENAVAIANGAVSTAGFANDAASKAQVDAGTAMTNSLQALNTANGLSDKVTTNTASIDNNTKMIALKANQTDVDSIAGRVTTAEGTLKVMNDQVAQSVTHSELTSTLDGYATQSWTQGQITTTADSIKSTVSSVQTQVTNSAVGINLLRNTSPSDSSLMNPLYKPDKVNWTITSGGDGVGSFTDVSGLLAKYGFQILNNTSGNRDFKQYFDYDNKPYVFSVYAKPTGVTQAVALLRIWDDDSGIAVNWTSQTINSSDGWTRLVLNVDAEKYTLLHRIGVQFGITGAGGMIFACPKLESGTIPTDYDINPADSASVKALSTVEQTVKGIQTTVSDPVNGIVAKQTLLANQYTSVIGGLTNDNLVPYSGYWSDTTGWSLLAWGEAGAILRLYKHSFYHNAQDNTLVVSCYTATGKSVQSKRFPVKRNTKYTFQFKGFASGNVKATNAYFLSRTYGSTNDYDSTGIHHLFSDIIMSPSHIDTYTITFTTGATDDEGYIRFDNGGTTNGAEASIFVAEIKMEQGSIATQYSRASGSEMVQTANDINLRVEKNGVINAVNVSTEGIQIYGNKLHITATTYIDSSVIKSAMIDTLTADKITAGTLNGNNVNVINLNASHITTGTLTGSNLQINLSTGMVTFQKGRIHNSTNTIDINIDSGYISTANGNARVMMKDGEVQLVEPQLFDNETTPYLKISNAVSGASFSGAAFQGRDYAVFTNSANSGSIFTSPMGVEAFSGISTGKSSSSGWQPTKIGGADRGVFISGGKATSYSLLNTSPYISIGSNSSGSSFYNNRIVIDGQYIHMPSVYYQTSSQSANVVVAQDGALVRSTSASKYKTNIVRGFSTDYGEKLIDLPTATWIDKASLERYNEDPTRPVPKLNYGMIAEDLAAAGVEKLVVRNDNGGLEGIQYDRIAVALLPLIKNMKQRIDELEEKLGA